MTNPIESMISLIAPYRCLVCAVEGRLLCKTCSEISIIAPPARCYRCHQASPQSRVCSNCRRYSGLSHVWVSAEYEEAPKALIHKLKFDRAQAAAGILAEIIDQHLPVLPERVVVTHAPTANKRVRVRGYDQAKLIAQALAARRGWRYRELLARRGTARQVGSSRRERLTQLQHAFTLVNANEVKDAHVLLIDDVLTTGATIEAAAKTLKPAGAFMLDAAVFSQPISD